ncbi:hypothetical protein [Aliiroseovarius crassostreae]|uniref:hypothetical protein n=1 Tax=Aliiroseovarius crassostreae TaxID=154981 RepID=UPI003C7C401D
MSKLRYVFLLALVISAGGLTILVAGMAASSGNLNGQTAMALMPLLLLVTVAWRALNPDKKD